MAMLKVVTGQQPAWSFELTRRETVVGRHPRCDIVLSDTTVSRRHARILCEKDGYYIEDLGSQHGTVLNGHLLRFRERLRDHDQIRIRDTLLTFLLAPQGEEDEPVQTSGDRPSTIISSRDASSSIDKQVDVNAQQKLRALLQITRILGASLDVKQIFPRILDSVFEIFPQASRGCILLAEDTKLVPRAIKQTTGDPTRTLPISRTIAHRVMSRAEAILSENPVEDQRFQLSDSIVGLDLRSVMCAPLIGTSDKPLGMIQIETKDPRRHFTADDLDVLVNVANLSGQLVAHARLHETQLQFDRRERDLEVARQVQLHFLPQDRPQIPGYQVADFYRAAEGVGGDYFGYLDLPDGRQALAMGDVSGKGVPAALLMARLCSEVRYCLVTNPQPADAVCELNRQISKSVVLGGFITFVLCVLDPATHEVVVVNAGHMPPLWRRARHQTAESVGLQWGGPPLGVDVDRRYRQGSIHLEPGDAVFLYTDGVNEATNPRKKMFGTERIEQLVAVPRPAEATVEAVLQELEQFSGDARQADDICMLCFSRDVQSTKAST